MKLFYREYGKGYPLIILHGLFGISDNWQNLARRFSETFKVLVPDHRNHGRSPHDDAFNYDVLVDDMLEFLADHDIDTCHVIGHSMGGKIGMRLAQRHPGLISKLVVADIAPKYYPVLHRDMIDAMLTLNFSIIHSRKDASMALREKIPQLSIRNFLLKNLTRDKNGKFKWRINLEAISTNIENISNGFSSDISCSCPALFIRGDLSYYVHDADITEIERLFPNALLQTMAGASHWLHAEKPDEFYDKVMMFLMNE